VSVGVASASGARSRVAAFLALTQVVWSRRDARIRIGRPATWQRSTVSQFLISPHGALRHPDLPAAQLDGPARELRLLVDHREDLVAERTRCINRLRWHLHELDPAWDPQARSLTSYKNLGVIAARLDHIGGPVARIAGEIVAHVSDLTVRERALDRDITTLVEGLAPTLLSLVGVGALTAAKIVAETADVRRFRSKDAYDRHNGTAPLPVWSGNRERHRLSRTSNRQLNAAIHRIAITQMRCHDDARAYLERRTTIHKNTKTQALRVLNDVSPTSSTAACSQTPNSRPQRRPSLQPLDIGANDVRPLRPRTGPPGRTGW
jgi:hypothetical protein